MCTRINANCAPSCPWCSTRVHDAGRTPVNWPICLPRPAKRRPVTASKLAHRATARAFAFDRVDVLVTELEPADRRLDPFRDHVKIR